MLKAESLKQNALLNFITDYRINVKKETTDYTDYTDFSLIASPQSRPTPKDVICKLRNMLDKEFQRLPVARWSESASRNRWKTDGNSSVINSFSI